MEVGSIGYKPTLSNTIFQIRIVGGMRKVPHTTLAVSSVSPMLYLWPKENEAIDIGNAEMRMAALYHAMRTGYIEIYAVQMKKCDNI